MKQTQAFILGLCVSALAAGCNKPTTETQPAPSASAAPLTDEALDQAKIPVKEDFEQQASQEITDENLEEQVSQLEQQIEQDK
ncbi:MAG TPA: hypothetical protein VKP30_16880 [Polyangiaceae bacterium]|nr:hypothetical protein [Polyangiaceae bacterium]